MNKRLYKIYCAEKEEEALLQLQEVDLTTDPEIEVLKNAPALIQNMWTITRKKLMDLRARHQNCHYLGVELLDIGESPECTAEASTRLTSTHTDVLKDQENVSFHEMTAFLSRNKTKLVYAETEEEKVVIELRKVSDGMRMDQENFRKLRRARRKAANLRKAQWEA